METHSLSIWARFTGEPTGSSTAFVSSITRGSVSSRCSRITIKSLCSFVSCGSFEALGALCVGGRGLTFIKL